MAESKPTSNADGRTEPVGEDGRLAPAGIDTPAHSSPNPKNRPDELEAALREELVALWGDLHRARGAAISGQWSMECDGLEDRIKNLTQLVGATPWEDIQIPLLEDGIYQRIHTELGIDAPVDMERVAAARGESQDNRD